MTTTTVKPISVYSDLLGKTVSIDQLIHLDETEARALSSELKTRRILLQKSWQDTENTTKEQRYDMSQEYELLERIGRPLSAITRLRKENRDIQRKDNKSTDQRTILQLLEENRDYSRRIRELKKQVSLIYCGLEDLITKESLVQLQNEVASKLKEVTE